VGGSWGKEEGGVTDVGSVDEAEEIEEGYCRDDHEIDLETEFGLGLGVDLDERMAISGFVWSVSLCLLTMPTASLLVCCCLASLGSIMKGPAVFIVRWLDGVAMAGLLRGAHHVSVFDIIFQKYENICDTLRSMTALGWSSRWPPRCSTACVWP
jgi:hypothetical protein